MENKHLSILDVAGKPKWISEYEFTFIDKVEIEIKYIFSSISAFFRNIIYGVKNLIYYFPVIWHDRYWDYEFMLDLLEIKIKQMRDGIKKDNILAETDKYVSQMNDTLYHIICFKEASDRFEMMSQDRLKEIQLIQDETERNEMIRKYYTDSMNYEDEQWGLIWEHISDYGRHWWD